MNGTPSSHLVALFVYGFVGVSLSSISGYGALAQGDAQYEYQFSVPTTGSPGGDGEASFDSGSLGEMVSPAAVSGALAGLSVEPDRTRRGVLEAQIFRDVSPSVVLVVTSEGMGSGSLLSADGEILTNWHVVGDERRVGVIFQPENIADVADARVIEARVVQIDEIADLALLRLSEAPPTTARVITLAENDSLSVGDDVHAVGHPVGQAWTYTKGYVSQVRPGFEWGGDMGFTHQADVVQTQTPINPGNSGGPLVNDFGAMVGVNSFTLEPNEGLNYAVSVGEVHDFLSRTISRIALRDEAEGAQREFGGADGCQTQFLFDGRNEDDDADLEIIDLNCNGKPDLYYLVPDDELEPIYVLVDRDENEKIDGEVQDLNRDGKWDASFWDENENGTPDLFGYHVDGELTPSSYGRFYS